LMPRNPSCPICRKKLGAQEFQVPGIKTNSHRTQAMGR
jgi:hypothetical protein